MGVSAYEAPGRDSAACSTALAMGAATRRPVASLAPGWASTMTATAMRGASAGAKPMIHAWDVPVPVWAVPVLAATCTPGMAMAVAVPPLTTPTMRSRSVEATAGGTAVRHGLGFP